MNGLVSNSKKLSTTRELLLFSIPIIFGQLGIMLIGVGDVFVATKFSILASAALGVALGFINPIFLFGIGLMTGISPVISIKRGKGLEANSFYFSNIIYAICVGLLCVLLMYIVKIFIPHMGIDEKLVPYVLRYIEIIAWSFPFAFIFQAIKEHLQALEKVILANVTAMVAVVLNLIFNFGFVFGKWGIPEFGYDGLAYASFGIRIFLAISLVLMTIFKYSSLKISWDYISSTFKFSFPIASMFFLEVLGFCIVSIVIGTLGVNESAANSIVLNFASVTFMIPLSISSGATVKVGYHYGKKNFLEIKSFIQSALTLSMGFMLMTCVVFILFPTQLMQQLTLDVDVISIGVEILLIVGIFQLVDGLQVTLTGVLRGLEKTKESFIATIIGYWVLGIPFGLYLTFKQEMGAKGLWIGLACSLTLVSIMLSVITKSYFRSQKPSIGAI